MKTRRISALVTWWLAGVLLLALLPAVAVAKDTPSVTEQLSNAVARGDVEAIKILLGKGADINAKLFGESPLMAAIRWKQPHLLQLLLEKGADPNQKDDRGWTPLQLAFDSLDKKGGFLTNLLGCHLYNAACRTARFTPTAHTACTDDRHAAIVRLLLDHGADPNVNVMNGTLLTWASIHGQVELVRLLLRKGVDVRAKAWSSATALSWAALGGHDDVVRLLKQHGAVTSILEAAMIGDTKEVQRLLKAGADISGKNDCGRTPLMEAAWGGDCDTIKALLENGADINVRAADGTTAFTVAAWRGNVEAAELLLDNGAEVNAPNKHGWTPLIEATWSDNLDVARLLLENGAELSAKDNLGKTAFIRAVEMGHVNVAKLLLDKGANVNERDADGWTAVATAANRRDPNMMRLLCQYGARVTLHIAAMIGDRGQVQRLLGPDVDINGTDAFGQTPLLWATAMGHPDVAQLLVDKGAGVSIKDRNGWTPLMWAARYGQTETVKLLLDKGAVIDAAAQNGWTPLMWATKFGHSDSLKILADRGAKVNLTNCAGDTALDIAHRNQQIVAILKSHGAMKPERDPRKRGTQCGPEWDYESLCVVTGAPAPKSPHKAIRMDSQEVIMRLKDRSFVVDAVFHFFNTGETTTEWVGFPRQGNACRDGHLLEPAFIRFDTWIDGRKVEFSDERGFLRRARDFLFGAPISSPQSDPAPRNTYDRWLGKHVTFPGGARTTIRLSYEDDYAFGASAFIVGTASYWKDRIRHFAFTVDASGISGTRNLNGACNVGLCSITENAVRYEVTDYKPKPEDGIGASQQRRDIWDLAD